jgi:hypothetical protein
MCARVALYPAIESENRVSVPFMTRRATRGGGSLRAGPHPAATTDATPAVRRAIARVAPALIEQARQQLALATDSVSGPDPEAALVHVDETSRLCVRILRLWR